MQLHELFLSYMAAGFNRSEAFDLVRTIMAAVIANPPKPKP